MGSSSSHQSASGLASALAVSAAGLVAAVATDACARVPEATRPVAIPSLEINTTRPALDGVIEARFSFAVLPNIALDEDFCVFVHIVNDDGELMWTDDHDPPQPTSTWAPDTTVAYTRAMFVPRYPYLGPAAIHLGLYSRETGMRLPLLGEDVGQRTYRVQDIRLLPPSDNVVLTYGSGWHDREAEPNDELHQWRWMQKIGSLSFRNPQRESLLYLHIEGVKPYDEPQRLTVSASDHVVARLEIKPGDIVRKIPLTTAVLGSERTAELTLEVDQTFVPRTLAHLNSADDRELGVKVLHAVLALR